MLPFLLYAAGKLLQDLPAVSVVTVAQFVEILSEDEHCSGTQSPFCLENLFKVLLFLALFPIWVDITDRVLSLL